MIKEPRTICRTPTPDKKPTSVPSWKFELLSQEIKSVIGAAGDDGFLFSRLAATVGERLEPEVLERLGSVGWHVTTVKLEMEVRGDLQRLSGNGPQRLIVG